MSIAEKGNRRMGCVVCPRHGESVASSVTIAIATRIENGTRLGRVSLINLEYEGLVAFSFFADRDFLASQDLLDDSAGADPVLVTGDKAQELFFSSDVDIVPVCGDCLLEASQD